MSFLSTLLPVPACEMNTRMTSLLYYWLGSVARRHTHTRLHAQVVHTLPFLPHANLAESKSTECKKFDGCCLETRAHGDSMTADVIDSAFATAAAQGQLKEVRPCQSTQECWQTDVRECVCPSLCVYVCVDSSRSWMSSASTLAPATLY